MLAWKMAMETVGFHPEGDVGYAWLGKLGRDVSELKMYQFEMRKAALSGLERERCCDGMMVDNEHVE